MNTHCLNSLDELAAASERWDELYARSEFAFPSTQAALIAQWMQHFASGHVFRAIAVEQNGDWQAALALVERRLGGLRIAELPGNEWSPVSNLLLDSVGNSADVIRTLLAALDQQPWSLLRLEPIRLDAPQWQLLLDAFQNENRPVFVEPLFNVGQVSTTGDWDEYFASRSRNLRKDLGKSERRLESLGTLTTKLYFEPDDSRLAELLERGFAVEDRSWKGRRGTSVLKTRGMIEFYCSQAKLLRDRAQLQLSLLELDDQPIAFEYGWRCHGTYFSFKVGYDDAYERHSPGQLLRMKLLEQAFADEEIRTFDFFGPLNNALAAWATEAFPIGRVVAGKPTLRGRSLVAAYRYMRSLKQRIRSAKHAKQYTLRPAPRRACVPLGDVN